MTIQRIKYPNSSDKIEYDGKRITIEFTHNELFISSERNKYSFDLTVEEAKELAQVLPEFIKEMEGE